MSRTGWPGSIAILVILGILAIGLPLANSVVADVAVPLRAGTVIEVGQAFDGGSRPVSMPVPAGWSLDESASSLSESVTLVSGGATVQLGAIDVASATPQELWTGQHLIFKAQGVPVRAESPTPIQTVQGVPGLVGMITLDDRTGTQAVFAAPQQGASVLVGGDAAAVAAHRDDISQMIASIKFAGGPQ
ncbi:hypothetical protein [Herbidospora sp. NBRC 101105]|uniref:hypothetical protein n=1 Tax=Herbidospora sp. NBRC 101105 TaxID=3032195 RepID=UPI0024A0EF70|nr:hypothetical protein [Herbidospora sp. NBRC 101105]GLX94996.1 hypothetical protein Hesp01_29460 [Herbidospora sp. NBRC 101105]